MLKTKSDMANFNIQLSLSLSVDTAMRSIQERVKLAISINDNSLVEKVIRQLETAGTALDAVITDHLPDASNE